MHGYTRSTNSRFCLYLQLITWRRDQETPFSTRLLNGRAHDPVDQFFQDHLARHRLRDLDYGRQI